MFCKLPQKDQDPVQRGPVSNYKQIGEQIGGRAGNFPLFLSWRWGQRLRTTTFNTVVREKSRLQTMVRMEANPSELHLIFNICHLGAEEEAN